MSPGSPVLLTGGVAQLELRPLATISAQRDDPSSFQETLLQEVVDRYPNVLPIREFLPSATTLFSLGREVQVDIGGNMGYIDNLLVTNDGYPVIVETKLYRNPEAIRLVVTQALQYGMAIGRMPLLEFEARIRRSQNPAIWENETVRDCISRLAAAQNVLGMLADDFEEAVERHLRRGEILLLVVSDGIHIGVERITHWLNEEGNTTAFKFGLVELNFYALGNDRLVVPRTVLKTREVSRHVVVVDIRPTADATAITKVTDEYRNTSGGKVQESRQVKAASPELTKNLLLQIVAPEDREAVSRIIEQLEILGFDQRGTTGYLHFGFTFSGDGEFHPLAYFGKRGIWTYPLKQIRSLLGADGMAEFHRKANQFGRFYRDEQLDKPDSTGCEVKYRQLQDAPGFAAFLDEYRSKVSGLLQASDGE